MQGVQNGVKNWVRCFENLKLSGVTFASDVTDRNEINGHPTLKETYEAGRSCDVRR